MPIQFFPLRTVGIKHIERTLPFSKSRTGMLIVHPWILWDSTVYIKAFVRDQNLINVFHNRGTVFAPCPYELLEGGAIINVDRFCWCAGTS